MTRRWKRRKSSKEQKTRKIARIEHRNMMWIFEHFSLRGR